MKLVRDQLLTGIGKFLPFLI